MTGGGTREGLFSQGKRDGHARSGNVSLAIKGEGQGAQERGNAKVLQVSSLVPPNIIQENL